MNPQTPVQIVLKPLNHKQLAAMYGVTHKTLKSWLKPLKAEVGEMTGRSFTIKQVQTILNNLGLPKGTVYKES